MKYGSPHFRYKAQRQQVSSHPQNNLCHTLRTQAEGVPGESLTPEQRTGEIVPMETS